MSDTLDALSGFRCWYLPVFRQWVCKPPDTFWSNVPPTEKIEFFQCRLTAWRYTRDRAKIYKVPATLYTKRSCRPTITRNYSDANKYNPHRRD